jgi:dTDP-glucose 4,6-dehydratase
MRILVTGGAGFIGSNYVRRLLTGAYPAFAAAEVRVLDKLTYAGNPHNLDPVAHKANLSLTVGDICDRRMVDTLMRGVDLVVHFAAESHVDRSIAGSGEFVRTNVLGTHTLLDAALRAGVDRFVHVSTDEVYGSIAEGHWDEAAPLAPNSPYSASKASSDLLALAFHRTHGLDVRVTRCSNNYGPYQFPEKLVPLFLTRLLNDQKVPLYGDGRHRRDWLHVDDHCAGLQLVAEAGAPGAVYNIGGGTELSNRRLTELLLAAVGAEWSMVEHVPDRKGHDLRYSVDIRRISTELGYRPTVAFPQGLADTIRWYREHPQFWAPAPVT